MAFKLNLPKSQTTPAQSQEFTPAELWANIGYHDIIDGEEVFISLTRGIPLDQLKPMKGNSELAKRKNRLTEMVAEAAASLEPGQAEEVTNLVIQIRRAAPAETEVAENETTLHKLEFGKKSA